MALGVHRRIVVGEASRAVTVVFGRSGGLRTCLVISSYSLSANCWFYLICPITNKESEARFWVKIQQIREAKRHPANLPFWLETQQESISPTIPSQKIPQISKYLPIPFCTSLYLTSRVLYTLYG